MWLESELMHFDNSPFSSVQDNRIRWMDLVFLDQWIQNEKPILPLNAFKSLQSGLSWPNHFLCWWQVGKFSGPHHGSPTSVNVETDPPVSRTTVCAVLELARLWFSLTVEFKGVNFHLAHSWRLELTLQSHSWGHPCTSLCKQSWECDVWATPAGCCWSAGRLLSSPS